MHTEFDLAQAPLVGRVHRVRRQADRFTELDAAPCRFEAT